MPADEGSLPKAQKYASDNLLYAYILASIGFGCMIGWDIIGLFAPALPLLQHAGTTQSLILCSIGFAATGVSFIASNWLASDIFNRRDAFSIAAALCGILVAIIGFLHRFFSIPLAVDVISWLAFGFGKSMFCLVWCAYLSSIPSKHTGVSIGCGAVFGSILFAITSMVAPEELCLLAAFALPIFSLAILRLLSRAIPKEEETREAELIQNTPRSLGFPAALSLATHGVVYGFITYYACLLDPRAGAIVGSSGIIGCALVAVLSYVSPKTNFDNSIVQRISQPVIIIGLLLIPMAGHEGKIICCCLANSALAFTNIMAWSTSCVENYEFHLQPIARFGSRQGPLWIGLFAGAILTMLIWPFLAADATLLQYFVISLAALTVISFSIYGADDSKTRHQLEDLITIESSNDLLNPPDDDAESAHHESSFRERCQNVSERYGLSPREKEVFYLLAKGRNAKFIQEDLCVSASTVKTHIYRIYRKMGINSQQLLIDSVDEEEAQ